MLDPVELCQTVTTFPDVIVSENDHVPDDKDTEELAAPFIDMWIVPVSDVSTVDPSVS